MSKQTDLLNLTDGISVDASGNVGIGASSFPANGTNLKVEDATISRLVLANTGDSTFEFGSLSGGHLNIYDATADAERLRITSTGSVGIGTSSPDAKLRIQNDNSTVPSLVIRDGGTPTTHMVDISSNATGTAMRIDASGKLLVGKTADDNTSIGLVINGNGYTKIVRSSATANVNSVLQLNRLTSDGYILALQKDGTTVGNIGTDVGRPYFVGVSSGVAFGGTQAAIWPTDSSGVLTDNAYDVGSSGVRFDDIYATNGTIQTSDRNEKEAIASLTPTEMLVAAHLSSSFKNFKWKNAVAEKGAAARMHSGIIAQDVQDAFAAEGLDAGDYAMFISSTWWETQTDVPAVEAVAEVVDEDGVVVTEAVEAKEAYTRTDTYETLEEAPEGATERTRLGIRYPELLAFVAAYNDQRFLTIEARLTALEAT